MFEKLLSYKQIDDLRHDIKMGRLKKNTHGMRSDFRIAVIDDHAFPYEQMLKSNGYVVDYIGDIRNISEVSEYAIILCDLQGVGQYLNKQSQGAFIIDEIKRNHPEKIVIAYTGGASDDAITLRAQEFADFFLKKDLEFDEWRDRLDATIDFLSDPIKVWNRQRDALVEAEVPTLDILRLEDAFVRSVKGQTPAPYERLILSSSISSDLRAIAQSMIASGLFKVFVG